MAARGRPRLQLDEGLIERLAMIHCPLTEIAAALDCSVDTLERNYAAIIAKGREKGKLTLRRIQFEAAQKGNVVMMIWLGKQLLGQHDKIDQNISAHATIHQSSERKAFIENFKKELEASSNERQQSPHPSRKEGPKD